MNIEEVLNRLPQVQANAEQSRDDSEGRQRIKLRSLGYERTLTLIDGMRVGLPNSLDIGIIPTALVERIDILTGGASSVYGSDAVSGVVNFILRKKFEGVRVDANYNFYNHNNRNNDAAEAARRAFFTPASGMTNDGGRADVSLTAGLNLFDNRVNFTTFINYRQADRVTLADRSYSKCEVIQTSNTAPLSCFLATFTPNGTIIPQSGPNAGQVLVNDPNGSGGFVGINSGPNTSASPYDNFTAQRPFNRVNLGSFLTADITDNMEFYANGLFYRDRSANTILNRTLNFGAYGEGPYQLNCDNPFLSASQATDICGARAGQPGQFAPIDVRYRFDAAPPVDQRYTNEGYRVVAGLRGRALDNVWSYDLSGMLSKARLDTFDVTFPDYDRVNRSLDVVRVNGVPTCRSAANGSDPACVPFNAFIPYNSSTALNQYLFGAGTGAVSTRFPTLWQFLGTISGDLGQYGISSPLAEQGVAIALGAEYRTEKERFTANEAFRELNGGEDLTVKQNILEANIEVQAPLIERRSWTRLLQVNGGYRVSKYNKLDGKFDTWKVEGLWAPVEGVTFRGSYNKAQAAPGVGAVAGATNVTFNQGFYSDPCAPRVDPTNPNGPRLPPTATAAQCRNTGLPDALYGSPTLICPDDRCTVREGGFPLMPETAYTKTFGVIVRPQFLPGLTVSVDRFLIDLEDQLVFLQPPNLIAECLATGLEYFCSGIFRNPGTGTLSSPPTSNPTAGFTGRGPANGFKEQSYGWDFQGQYNFGLGSVGFLDLNFNGTLMTRVGGQSAPNQPQRNCVGFFGSRCGESLPKWQHQFRTTWTSAARDTSISLNWRHRGATPLDLYASPDRGLPEPNPGDFRDQYPGIKAYDWFDLAVAYDINQRMTFRIAANNIFDRDPPLVPNARATIGLLRSNTIMGYDQLGRQLVASISARF